MIISYKVKVCRRAGTADQFDWELWKNDGFVTGPIETGTAETKEAAFDAARSMASDLAAPDRSWERVLNFQVPDPVDAVEAEVVVTDMRPPSDPGDIVETVIKGGIQR